MDRNRAQANILRHGLGAGAGGVADGDAVLFSVLHVDVVHAYAAADDQLQLARFLGRIDVGSADLGGGPDHQHVVVLYGFLQGFGIVELLIHLATLGFQRGHRALLHTVRRKNLDHSEISSLRILSFVLLQKLHQGLHTLDGHGVVHGRPKAAHALVAL